MVFFWLIGSFDGEDAQGSLFGILGLSALLGVLFTYIARGINGGRGKNSQVDVVKISKNLKNTGNSVYAIGWVTLVLNVLIDRIPRSSAPG